MQAVVEAGCQRFADDDLSVCRPRMKITCILLLSDRPERSGNGQISFVNNLTNRPKIKMIYDLIVELL